MPPCSSVLPLCVFTRTTWSNNRSAQINQLSAAITCQEMDLVGPDDAGRSQHNRRYRGYHQTTNGAKCCGCDKTRSLRHRCETFRRSFAELSPCEDPSPRDCWIRPSTTPSPSLEEGMFTVTHPFHPLYGQQFEILNYRSEEHTSELQSHLNIVCRLLLEKKNK